MTNVITITFEIENCPLTIDGVRSHLKNSFKEELQKLQPDKEKEVKIRVLDTNMRER